MLKRPGTSIQPFPIQLLPWLLRMSGAKDGIHLPVKTCWETFVISVSQEFIMLCTWRSFHKYEQVGNVSHCVQILIDPGQPNNSFN